MKRPPVASNHLSAAVRLRYNLLAENRAPAQTTGGALCCEERILIRSLRGVTPQIAPTAWVSEFAYVVGNVVIGEHSSVWPGVTIRGDGELITIGNNVNIQEGSVVHGDGLVIEDNVSIGHCVVVHGDRIGAGSLLGNNCTFLTESTIGRECLIAANSVVLSGVAVPDRSFVTGVPGSIKRQVTDQQVEGMRDTAEHLVERAEWFKESGL